MSSIFEIRFPTSTTPPAVRAAFRSRRRYVRAHSGWGGGKTYLGVNWMIKGAAYNPGLTGIVVEPTHGMVNDTLRPTIVKVCEQHQFPYRFERPNGRLDLIFPSLDYRYLLRSGDNPDSLVGPTLANGWIDEAGLQEAEVLTRVDSRLRDARASFIQLLATGTPDQLNWFYSFWHERAGDPDFDSFHWRTRDNAANIAPGYVEGLRKTLDEFQFRAYEGGEFVNLTAGVVFPKFLDRPAPEGNLVAPFRPRPLRQGVGRHHAKPPSRIVWTMDFNVDPMTAAGWVLSGAGEQREARAFTEIVRRHSNVEEIARELRERYPFAEYPGQKVICDATGSSASSTTGRSHVDILEQFGYEVDYKHVQNEADPINATRRMICNGAGVRRLFVAEDCKMLRTSFRVWSYKPNSNKTREDEYARDNDLYFVPHLMDNAKYLCWVLFPIYKPDWKVS